MCNRNSLLFTFYRYKNCSNYSPWAKRGSARWEISFVQTNTSIAKLRLPLLTKNLPKTIQPSNLLLGIWHCLVNLCKDLQSVLLSSNEASPRVSILGSLPSCLKLETVPLNSFYKPSAQMVQSVGYNISVQLWW